VGAINSEYLTDEEYKTYWLKLEGIRKAISGSLELKPGVKILDVGTGSGFFSLELAKHIERGKIVGIDTVEEAISRARKLVKAAKVSNIVSITEMDALELSFSNDYFGLVTSFLGMRDIHMTRRKRGVKKAVQEMIRVLKPTGKIVLCITPPEDMETEDQKIAVKLEGEIFGAKSLPRKFYLDIFEQNNVVLRETRTYYTHKKLTAAQTRQELKDGLEMASQVYGRKVPSFNDVWGKYGKEIEAVGYGMYSEIVVLIGQKRG
jgi:ubiquinone/menaquinone biosynthesis C-methylase UbiE